MINKLKVGDVVWIQCVWTNKSALSDKLHACIHEVTIEKIFDDESCLLIDHEGLGIYKNIVDLLSSKKEAVLEVNRAAQRWLNNDDEDEE